MALYFKDIEITNIDNLVPQAGLDITDLWFGSTNIYTVWQTYEGTLPATINANGDNMKQYQVWGNTGGVGNKTVQLFDKNATDTDNGYIAEAGLKSDGTLLSNNSVNVSEYIPVSGNTVYILRYGMESGYYDAFSACFYDISKIFISGISYSKQNPKLFTTPAAAAYVRFSFSGKDANIVVLAKGSTISEPIPPFGYEVDMVVSSSNVMPSAPAETKTSNGITITCDGEGRYIISGRATAKASIQFNIPEFTIPVSHGQGGQGTMSLFNTAIKPANDNKIGFYYNSELVDDWSLHLSNRVNDAYVKMGNKKCNAIIIDILTPDNVSGILSPMFTDNGTLPDEYQPHSNTTTPIYIGNEPLDKDEYIDYTKQKVYRRTVNLFDKNATDTTNGYVSGAYIKSNGELQKSSAWFVSEYISANAEEQYTVVYGPQSSSRAVCYYDINKNYISGANYSGLSTQETITTPSTCAYMRLSLVLSAKDTITVTPGTTPPETYIPYYRPTDPPVALPALPTCEGTTIVDFLGSGTAPEKVLLKYRKE